MPEQISESSMLMGVAVEKEASGVVFDTLTQVEKALTNVERGISFNEGTNKRLLDDVKEDSEMRGQDAGLATAFLLLAGMDNRSKSDISAQLIQQAAKKEADKDETMLASGSYEYDAMGTGFFKSSVRILRYYGKYILEISQAYYGNKIEERIANGMGTHTALIGSRAVATYTNVDLLWFNIDIAPYAKILNIEEKFMPTLAASMANSVTGNILEKPKSLQLNFDYEGHKMEISLYVRDISTTYDLLSKGKPEEDRHLIRSEGTHITGGANWMHYDDAGHFGRESGLVVPKPPELAISVSLPDRHNINGRKLIVDKKEIELVLAARDSIQKSISETLLRSA